jgi:dATP pyrophosphohydrolase
VKQPVSVLVLIHTPQLEVLLLERSGRPGYWQSVTGSREGDETLVETALREVQEETGIVTSAVELRYLGIVNRYRIFEEWRHRYAPGIYYNTEHVFALAVPAGTDVRIAPAEHLACRWLPWQEAAEACFSWSNRDAILMLPRLAETDAAP